MATVRMVNPGGLKGRRRRRRMPTALRRYWNTHRRQGKRIVRTRPNPRRRRRNMPKGLKQYWARVRQALRVKSNPRRRRKGVNRMARKHRRRRRMPAGLARYWASRRARRSNPRRRSRRRSYNSHRSHRRRNPRVVYMNPRRRSRRRHNPLLGSIQSSEILPLTLWGVGGMAGARILPQMLLPSYNNGFIGYGLNIAATLAMSWAAKFFGAPRASKGLLVGGFIGTAARAVSDFLGGSSMVGGALAGDLDFDLGFYIPNTFAVPTAGQGPYLLNPGVTGSPSMNGGMAAPPVVAVAPGSTGSAATAQGSQMTAAQLSASMNASGGGMNDPGRWQSPWAA